MDLSESDSDDDAPTPRMVDVSDPADETNGGRSYGQNYAKSAAATARAARPGSGCSSGDLSDLRALLFTPGPTDALIQCRVDRHKGGLTSPAYFELRLESNNRVLLSAERIKHLNHSSYKIKFGSIRMGDDKLVGKLKSNSHATEYSLHGPGLNAKKLSVWDDGFDEARAEARQQIATVKMVPRVTTHRMLLPNSQGPRDMQCTAKDLSGGESSVGDASSELHQLNNRKPRYDHDDKGFVLDFGGRVEMSSRKNFILEVGGGDDEDEEKRLAMVFGRGPKHEGKNCFKLDYGWPLTPLQAFGLALSHMDHSRRTI